MAVGDTIASRVCYGEAWVAANGHTLVTLFAVVPTTAVALPALLIAAHAVLARARPTPHTLLAPVGIACGAYACLRAGPDAAGNTRHAWSWADCSVQSSLQVPACPAKPSLTLGPALPPCHPSIVRCLLPQIEHHLFPTVSPRHYPAIAPIVAEECSRAAVPYVHYPTLAAALEPCVRFMRWAGTADGPKAPRPKLA